MASSKVTLSVQADDVETWLRKAAELAAKYGAWCDYINRATWNQPTGHGERLDDAKLQWRREFLKNKRLVEAFGVEYEPTSEEETLTVAYDYVGGKTKVVRLGPLGPVGWRTGSTPDYKHPHPSYRAGVHADACRAAADRVVRKWRATLAD